MKNFQATKGEKKKKYIPPYDDERGWAKRPFFIFIYFIFPMFLPYALLYNAAKFRSWEHLGRQLRFHDLKILGHVNEVIPYHLSEVLLN